jgi:hypothetical protein
MSEDNDNDTNETSGNGDENSTSEGELADDKHAADVQNLLAALVEQARALAIRIAGDPDRETQCHFCEAPLPLWENLIVLQLTGVAAHVECPADALQAKLKKVGPADDFPYADFSKAVDQRCRHASPTACSGVIDC